MRARTLLLFVLLPVVFLPTLAAAQTYTYSTLADFPATEGPFAAVSLIIDAEGNLYGTSRYGGIYGTDGGDGTVYKVTPAGVVTVLHSFGNGNDGKSPIGTLTRDAKGNIYGTTIAGGAHGTGTIFRLSPSGVERVLYSFPNPGQIYSLPAGGVTLDSTGNIYGYAYDYIQFYSDGGNIFELTPQGVFSILYNWCKGQCSAEPNSPVGQLVPNSAGGFFGATVGGGGIGTPPGNVFSFSPTGGMVVLHTFTSPDGAEGGPVLDSAGNLFGIEGPVFQSGGGVYEISAAGAFSMIYTLPSGYGFQQSNEGTPVLDSSDNLYNTTQTIDGSQIVYKVTPEGTETVLFTGTADQISSSGVVMDKAGNLYGSCSLCGTNRTGLIYKLTKN
ncbi:MAG TPA: choice-of-anchor tandem repeat GloVer-containing protein [Candidatus Sulfotelmatobacter sp.]|jgi:uncharacterized repeat protein (TIGR03803 family)